MRINDLYELLLKKFQSIHLNVIDLKNHESEFQTFLESVTDFFLNRQGQVASPNEANQILNAYPENTNVENKLTCGILLGERLIGFFEIFILFPNKAILSTETETIKKEIGDLEANRFTLSLLVIHEKHRNKGLGDKVIKIVEESMKINKFKYAHLVVKENNSNAKRFYIKHGYRSIKDLPQIINDKIVHSTIMMKKLF